MRALTGRPTPMRPPQLMIQLRLFSSPVIEKDGFLRGADWIGRVGNLRPPTPESRVCEMK
jgi:hypothetical protein